MKKLILISALLMMAFMPGFSQKYAFVDTDYILNNIPEYTDAQALLDDLSAEWQKEIEAKFQEIDKLYREYQAESILLPEDLKKQKENEIVQKEREAKDLQKKRFGKDGDLFKKRIELVQPIQEKIYNAIQDMAVTRNYAFIFDKASGAALLFADAKFDLSDDVLDEVGTVMQTVKRENRKRQTVELGGTGTGTGTGKGSDLSPGQMVPQARPGQGTNVNPTERPGSEGIKDNPIPPPGEKKPR
ncbi:MAG: OmpH family outer membrane protein [Bacteroidales bacterium]|nr:OmpH family outer membrane protein [Bacteroidales bacterium]